MFYTANPVGYIGIYRYLAVVSLTPTFKGKTMQIAVRTTYTAGVALIGAGVIAVSPIAPPVADIHLPAVRASAVQLAAMSQANPITQWGQIIAEALQNTKVLATGVLADPAPVLGQVIKNEIASAVTFGGALKDFVTAAIGELGNTPQYLRDAFGQLAAGQITQGLQTLLQAAISPIIVPVLTTNFLFDVQSVFRKPVQNMLNVIDTAINSPSGTGWVLAAGFPLISVMSDMVTATGDSLQKVLDSAKAGNLGAVLGAILAIPGTITGAFLNGYNGSGAGILGPYGIVQGLRNALHIIATAITPTAPETPVAATSVPQPLAGITVPVGEKSPAVAKPDRVAKRTVEVKAVAETTPETADGKAAAKPVAAERDATPATDTAATADANDDSADASAPAAKTDRRAHGSHKKSSSSDDSATPARKTNPSSKRDRSGSRGSGHHRNHSAHSSAG